MRRTRLVPLFVSAAIAMLALGVGLAQHNHDTKTPHVEERAAAAVDVAESLSPKLRELLEASPQLVFSTHEMKKLFRAVEREYVAAARVRIEPIDESGDDAG